MIARSNSRPKNRKRGRLIRVAAGPGWALLYPVDLWEGLTEDERAAVARRQADYMNQAAAADLDQVTRC
jgi:hypothetical protein